ncbi:ElaA protein [Dysgonomonas sp. PH5-45]|uniref:GNAT family N-acetyltransferase n=1 Tax=unclassified Dysgonomonas TaxID=2630389 RepID=UPI002476DAEB|nr:MULTISPECIES: GNAT family N-acetyltransferase [unclassified Dysgonomonas]MDH6354568.1 ElaA protein [Dysgonomonas sp. PH5-45]MDH6387376.1 ElaA protein [Dysgonomonas sp. PH5-37]
MTNLLTWRVVRFEELTTPMLYSVLHLRSLVFVVEQNCVYQDVDGKDGEALHVLGCIGDELVAYCRMFRPGSYFGKASIGRVVVTPRYRGRKYGHALMREAIERLYAAWGNLDIEISAQKHLEPFYHRHGFVRISDVYLEDGIPHIRMEKTIQAIEL